MPNLIILTPSLASEGELSEKDRKHDAFDDFNHPRLRRAFILEELQKATRGSSEGLNIDIRLCHCTDEASEEIISHVYKTVHSTELLEFLVSAETLWEALGEEGQDPAGFLNASSAAMIPVNMPLHRTSKVRQRKSRHVLGQMGYFCTDADTPIFSGIRGEFQRDAYLVRTALQLQAAGSVTYILPTHPGHHAATDCFGGYCYLNHAAALAANGDRVAILDVDYHCGNGTAAIFDNNPNVLVVSLHCDPDFDYPFHSGFADEVGEAGTICHLPLPPGTVWKDYHMALLKGLERIVAFGPSRCVVSLGLDTYEKDPCALRRAGFGLRDDDYVQMGRLIGKTLPADLPIVVVQEGGYRMECVGKAAADVVCNLAAERPFLK